VPAIPIKLFQQMRSVHEIFNDWWPVQFGLDKG
jgi:hypothetical protein